MHRVVALCLDGLVAFDLTAPAQAFALAAAARRRAALRVLDLLAGRRPGRARPAASGSAPQAGLGALRRADTVVVPAYAALLEPPPEEALAALRAAGRRGARRALGLHRRLRARPRRPARRPPGDHPLGLGRASWRARFPAVEVDPDALYVDEGEVMTSAGLSAGIDLSLHVIRKDFGAAAGERVARHMVAAPHREGGQAQFFEPAAGRRRPARWSRPGAGRPSASASRSTSPRWPRHAGGQPPHLRPPLPRGDRDDAAAVAALPATRWESSHCSGVVPVSSRKRRAKVRGLTPAWRGHRGDVERLVEALGRPAPGRLQRAAAGGGGSGSMNCAWPPSRCGGATMWRATRSPTAAPKSSRITCRLRSMPALSPAEVITSPSST